MARANQRKDDVLPVDKSDIVNGVGPIERIIDLSGHEHEEGVTSDGRCKMCGYDRGDLSTHTEIPEYAITCRNCNYIVGGEV